jgi:hypothetical protein
MVSTGLRAYTDVRPEERRDPDMVGVMVFKSLADALRCGFQVYDRTKHGYLVRVKTAAGWALAIVEHEGA